VAAAKTAVDAAIDAKQKPPPSDDAAAKTTELTGKLQAIRKTFEAAKGKLESITTDPKPVIDPKGATDTLTAADAAITAIASATAEAKATAIKAATDAVTAAEAAVKSFSDAVDAAVASPPTGEGVPNYAAYETAYNAYKQAKDMYNAAYQKASETALQSGGTTPSAEEIAAAKKALSDSLTTLVIDENIKNIEKIKTEADFNNLTEDGAKQKEITKLTDATKVYTESLEKLKQLQATYNAAVADKDDVSTEPAEEGAETEEEKQEKAAETMQTYNTFYEQFKKCLVQDEDGSAKIQLDDGQNIMVKLGKCFTDNKFQDVDMSPFFQAVQAASLNHNANTIAPKKFEEKYDDATEGGKTNHDLLLVIINSLATNEVNSDTNVDKTSFEELIKRLTDMLGDNNSPLMTKVKETYSPQAGGSKQSSSSSSKSKSKPKNKTKKNTHPNPNKSKTPKIKMNE
jgi:hypothetical protein